MQIRSEPPEQRLNPFAFPSETDFRFALLIVLLVSVCLANFYTFFLTTPTDFQRNYFDTLTDCFRRFPPTFASDLDLSSGLGGLSDRLGEEIARNEPAQACTTPVVNQLFLRIFAATAAVFVVAGLIFWLAPRWTIRRYHLSSLTADDAPEVVACLEGMCAEMQLRRRPVFLWNPLNAARSAFTFGNLSDQYVAMSMGLVTQFYADPEAFRAVVLHELSHLKNADLAKTQFATASWLAFLLCAALPGLFFSLFIDARSLGFGPLGWSRVWQVLLITGLILFVRNSILRVREYYADVRASTYLTDPQALEQVLAQVPTSATPQKTAALRRMFATHPPAADRAAILNDTRPLFFATFEVAAITGVALGMINATTDTWATNLGQLYFGQITALSLFLAVLLNGTVGLSVWRSTTAGRLQPPARQQLGRIALGVGVGLFIGGQLFDMAGTLDFLSTADLAHIIGLQFFLLLWALLGAAVTYITGLWLITCATAWSEVAAARQSPQRVYVFSFLVASGITAILVYLLTIAFALGQALVVGGVVTPLLILAAWFFMLGAIPAYVLASPLGPAFFIGIWALPLAAWLFRRQFRPIGEAPWGFLEPQAVGDTAATAASGGSEKERLSFSIPYVVRSVLILAAVFVALVALKWGVRFVQGVTPGPGVDYDDGLGVVILGAAVVLQVVLAVRVVWRVPQFRLTHALFGTCLLAALMALGNNVVNGIVQSRSLQTGFYVDDFQLFWGLGLLAALPAALVAMWWGGRGRRATPS